ncbi:hypothetical protein SUDANB108_07034 [Streptomyces sp. enrichment culture]|uniref:hypothetical protein n=1 Tax=Streptomyces sp. enrichment culture TaxID=1795815 RepID=UPI003F57AFA7
MPETAVGRAEDPVKAAVQLLTDTRTEHWIQRFLHLHDQAPCAAHPRDDDQWQAAAHRLNRTCTAPHAAMARTPVDLLELSLDLLLVTDPDDECLVSGEPPRRSTGPDAATSAGTRHQDGMFLDAIREAAWHVVLAPVEE